METGNYLIQVNLADDWDYNVSSYYAILDYSSNSMTRWCTSLEDTISSPYITLDTPLPIYDEFVTNYGVKLTYFLPLTKPMDVHYQYPELFV